MLSCLQIQGFYGCYGEVVSKGRRNTLNSKCVEKDVVNETKTEDPLF
jgi:hypothetical protein